MDREREAPAPTAPPRVPWTGRVLSVLTVALLLSAGLLLSDWLKDRERVSEQGAAIHGAAGDAAAPPAFPVDPRMDPWLVDAVDFGPVRPVAYGTDHALFTAGPSYAPPEAVFGSIVAGFEAGVTPAVAERAMRDGPSAVAALRLQVQVGRFPGGAFLLRIAPSVDRAREGRVVLEPGTVLLAWQIVDRWEYALFHFPGGVDLDAFVAGHRAPEDALGPLGPVVSGALEPTLALPPGGGDGGQPRTVFCRAHGHAGTAVRRVVDGLIGTGWESVHRSTEADGSTLDVLRGPAGQVWFVTPEPGADGGVVTVLFGA